MSVNVNAVVVLRTRDEKREGFLEILRRAKPKLLRTDGCLSVRIYADEKNPNTLVLIEEWTSKEKHQAYFGSLVKSGEWKYMAEHLATEPESRYCIEI